MRALRIGQSRMVPTLRLGNPMDHGLFPLLPSILSRLTCIPCDGRRKVLSSGVLTGRDIRPFGYTTAIMSQGSGDYFMSPRASTSKSSSGLSRRFTGLISRKSTQGPAKEKAKNEFGLNTVFDPDETTEVIADFVFVHGLGGGSSTTWCLKQNPEYFWPKEWLPKDTDFEGVRVHSFGYNATWATWLKSPLDVHAFGQSLVEELLSDPKVKGQDTPIVLIGHSMGGLVIKKTCILLKTNPEFAHLAKRLHSFYFLGTPHRGSNLAGVLNNLLRVSGSGHRAYVSGLETKSEMIRGLSDGFRVNYAGIHLHTFYESQPTPPVGMIVDMESATLGL